MRNFHSLVHSFDITTLECRSKKWKCHHHLNLFFCVLFTFLFQFLFVSAVYLFPPSTTRWSAPKIFKFSFFVYATSWVCWPQLVNHKNSNEEKIGYAESEDKCDCRNLHLMLLILCANDGESSQNCLNILQTGSRLSTTITNEFYMFFPSFSLARLNFLTELEENCLLWWRIRSRNWLRLM